VPISPEPARLPRQPQRQIGCSPTCSPASASASISTTRAALDVLMADDGLARLLERAVAAATARSRELAS